MLNNLREHYPANLLELQISETTLRRDQQTAFTEALKERHRIERLLLQDLHRVLFFFGCH